MDETSGDNDYVPLNIVFGRRRRVDASPSQVSSGTSSVKIISLLPLAVWGAMIFELAFGALTWSLVVLFLALGLLASGLFALSDQRILEHRGMAIRVSPWFAGTVPLAYLHLRSKRAIGDHWSWHRPVLVYVASWIGGGVLFVITLVLASARSQSGY